MLPPTLECKKDITLIAMNDGQRMADRISNALRCSKKIMSHSQKKNHNMYIHPHILFLSAEIESNIYFQLSQTMTLIEYFKAEFKQVHILYEFMVVCTNAFIT